MPERKPESSSAGITIKMDKKIDQIKAIFFDIDGTLAPMDGQIIDSALSSLHKLHEKGYLVFLCTGRPYQFLHVFLDSVDFDFDGFVFLNGQRVVLRDKEIRSITLPENEVKAGLRFIDQKHFCCNIHVGNETLTIPGDGEEHRIYHVPLADLDTLDYTKIFQISPFRLNAKEKEELMKLMPSCDITSWSDYGSDIVCKNSGKMEGMKFLLEDAGLTFDNVMAFGDGENDVEMIKAAAIGVAMGNGLEAIREAADYITERVENDGVFLALKNFGLIE